MQAQLATLSAQMQANPDCKVVVTGNGGGSKLEQQRSWDRVNAVIEYMSEKNNIDRNRFIFQYEGQLLRTVLCIALQTLVKKVRAT